MERSAARSSSLGYRPLTAAALASIALHAAVVALLALAPVGAREGALAGAPVIEARLVSLTPAATPAPQEGPPETTLMAAPRGSPAPPVSRPAARQPPPARPAPPALALGLSAAPHYFPAGELDVRPTPLAAIDAEYPQHAHGAGYLIIRVLINESGRVDQASVAVSEPEGFFEAAAVAAFTAARFAPGQRAGAPVKSELWVEIWFHSPFHRPKAPEAPLARTLAPEDFAPAGAGDASSSSP